jgi:hypothetical protein
MYTPLSAPVEAWHFDLAAPPEDSDQKCVARALPILANFCLRLF